MFSDSGHMDLAASEFFFQMLQEAGLDGELAWAAGIFADVVSERPAATVIAVVPFLPGLSADDGSASGSGHYMAAQGAADQAGEIIDSSGRSVPDILLTEPLQSVPAFLSKVGGTVGNAPVGPFVEFTGQHGPQRRVSKGGVVILLNIAQGLLLALMLFIMIEKGIHHLFHFRIFYHTFLSVHDPGLVSAWHVSLAENGLSLADRSLVDESDAF